MPDLGDEAVFDLVHRDPHGAIALAHRVLEHPHQSHEAVRARWMRGLARRELNDFAGAMDELERAHEASIELGDLHLSSQIVTSLALVIANQGDARRALAMIDEAEPALHGVDLARLVMQRGLLLHRLGSLDRAAREYQRALDEFSAVGDVPAEARLRADFGLLEVRRGRYEAARGQLEEAETLARRTHQDLTAAVALHNRGYLDAVLGRFADALDELADAAEQYEQLGNTVGAHLASVDRAIALWRVGLVEDAVFEVDRATAGIEAIAQPVDAADTLLLAARIKLASRDAPGARAAARRASKLFAEQERDPWIPLTDLMEVLADELDGAFESLAERCEDVSIRLVTSRWMSEALVAQVTAGKLYLRRGQVEAARRLLGGAMGARSTGSAADRAAAHAAHALLHEAVANRNAARRSVNEGLRVLAENQASIGALEARAHVASYGDALVQVGARLAVADRRPRELLARIESARGMVSLLPRATPPDDRVLAGHLADLRAVTEELRTATAEGEHRGDAQRRRAILEHRVRDHTRRSRATGLVATLTLGDAVSSLGERQLVEYANLDGILWAVTADRGRCVMHELGSIDKIEIEVDQIDFALNRLNRVQGSPASREAARETIRRVGVHLGEQLLPARVRSTGRPLVIVPTGRLHGLAWRALPVLAGRAVSVAPSLFGHTIARRGAVSERRPQTVLVAGPDLPAAPEELRVLSTIYPTATVLDVATSDAASCLEAFGTATLAHVACHGSFRSDNPLFSTLRVADGDLTVYDLERCERLPHTMVLSACNAAASSVLRGGALLGMSSSLIQFGVSSVVAPLTPVSDERSVALMSRLHRELAAGTDPAAALASAAVVDGDLDATASAFVVIGS